MIDSLHHRLADALRVQGQCLCHSKGLWPWKRDEVCKMCESLAAYELAKADSEIVQRVGVRPGDKGV